MTVIDPSNPLSPHKSYNQQRETPPTDKALADLLGEIEVDDARRGDAIYEREALVALINTLLAAMVKRAVEAARKHGDNYNEDDEQPRKAACYGAASDIETLTPADAANELTNIRHYEREVEREIWLLSIKQLTGTDFKGTCLDSTEILRNVLAEHDRKVWNEAIEEGCKEENIRTAIVGGPNQEQLCETWIAEWISKRLIRALRRESK